MNKEELQMLGFEIVAYSGDARSTLLTLLREVRQGKFDRVEEALKDADENLTLAHNSQTKILAEEASGKDMDMGFIFIHGQDHLMTTLLLRDLIQDFIELYKNK
ncbi:MULTISPECIES: PTS lactose/cellobiose transporter subunit IIA [Enterococcus]|uniref:PTS system lactose-specific EIIA component n=1 Tax=Enterococcus mundtii TaxID=53346 RepID=A0A1A6G567_ENTMU|nr:MULTISPECIES: PTS lactose/cellobiose transporter subunit IIA [Enterococcus]MBE6171894.1 PTS lactose/cellobiose transporter subunit IIA [Enterococcus faecium]GEN17466.1 PTS lactose transporter subunit IIA [Ligilactobacillus acidipiscis]AUB52879.1 PTS lactose transporter subunit IIA [Enterococcus mundtii]AZP93018.1 PTS lactose transporter subunit IIA [Enterococcus mundtii]EOH62303.1 PTS system, lactose-specific IIa component [Enterococcus mundtii ATCC 882]